MKRPARHRGFSVIEGVLSTLVIGVMLAAVLEAVAGARSAQVWNTERLRAAHLASDLMAQILDTKYMEPTELAIFGREPSEVLGPRSKFDDVDDFHNWSSTPPEKPDGTSMAGYRGWTRSARVEWVQAADTSLTSLTETGIKRITVTVTRSGVKLAELVSIRIYGTGR